MTEFDYELLAEFASTSTITASSKWTPTRTKLESNEVAEITHIEVFSPVTAEGTKEALASVYPVIDGTPIGEYVNLHGYYDYNTAPMKQQTRNLYTFGTPQNTNPLKNLTLKVKRSIGIEAFAGATDVTSTVRVRVWGYRYSEDETIRNVFGDSVYGAEYTMAERAFGREVTFYKEAVEISQDKWDTLAGGIKQAQPKLMPMMRHAQNAVATTINKEYEFSDSNVSEPSHALYFDFDENDALMITNLGVRANANLLNTFIRRSDGKRPENMFPTPYNTNMLHFGLAYPFMPIDIPQWYGLPALVQPYLINDEKGRVVIIDDGTQIPIDAVIAGIAGIRLEK